MRFPILAIASTIAATAVIAAPVRYSKRDAASESNIFNFALTLEHLEAEFYNQGLAKFDVQAFESAGFHGGVRERFVQIDQHESTHVTTLASAITTLGGHPVPPCKYKFPLDNLATFIAVARALENTGVSAYLGAAAGLTGDQLVAAGSISTVEARHVSLLNEILGQSGAPYSFDTPLSPREVFTMASNFIESCPYDLGITPFTQLTARLPMGGSTKVETWFDDADAPRQTWCQFLYSDKVKVSKREDCVLPSTVTGYVYVVITDTAMPITLKDDAHVLAGPALLFKGDH
ncbi:hypothetical protein BGX28_004437 [Mortierella sp. GBA30]|nr:hypothetical protein BGX28_004437 [Mortierella sp. GBA30]